MKIQTPRGNNIITRVDELINPVDSMWDANLIRSIFWDIDATHILQISITPGREDCVSWHYNRNGLFLVRSAYYGQWKKKYGARLYGAPSSGASNQQVWKKLWKLQVPEKIKIFWLEGPSWLVGL
jgi:hypothetical protein